MLTLQRLGLHGYRPAVWRFLIATGLVGFAVDGGIYAVLLNLYLLRMEYGPAQIGVVNAAGTFTFALASLPAGALGERWGSTQMMQAGIALMIAGCTLLPLADALVPAWQLPWLIVFVIVIYVGLAIFFVNGAPFLLATVPVERRTQVVGLQTATISLSAFAGGLLGGVLPPLFARLLHADADQPTPYRYALIAAALALALALVAVSRIAVVPRPRAPASPPPVAQADTPLPRATPIIGLLALIALVRMLQVAGVAALTTYTNVYLDAVLLVPTVTIGLILAASRLMGAAAALTTAGLARRFGNWQVVFWASVATVFCMLPIALIPHWGAAAVSLITVIGLSWVRYGASLVYFLELVPARRRATASGVLEMAAGLCFTIVTFGGGLAIAAFGYTTLFLAAAAMTALSAAAFWLFFRDRPAAPAEQPAPLADLP